MSKNRKPFSDQITVLIDEFGTGRLSEMTGISDTMLRKWRSGTSLPGLDKLYALSDATGRTFQWLATGTDAGNSGIEEKPAERSPFDKSIWSDVNADDFSYIPLYDVEASAGHGAWNSSEHEIYKIAFRKEWLNDEGLIPDNLAAITARGDSMNPSIKSGDTLLIDTNESYPVEGIYVLKVDAHLVVKRVQRLNGGVIRVKSDNPAYDSIDIDLVRFLDPQYIEDYSVIGKVVWSGRRL